MYEVFFNERKIVIARPGNMPFIKGIVGFENLTSTDELKNWFLEFTKSEIAAAVIFNPFPNKFWFDIFLPTFTCIPAAGGLVIRENKLLFIFRNEKWDLPKGKIDHGETAMKAALREVAEECGIEGHRITKVLPSTFHIYQSPYIDSHGQWILKETHWFEMNYSGSDDGIPETFENITKIKWFEIRELDEVFANTYENLKSVISIYKV